MSLIWTVWRRKTDDTRITIEGDSDGSRRSNRSLLARNTAAGRHFWVTPEGLTRKYEIGDE